MARLVAGDMQWDGGGNMKADDSILLLFPVVDRDPA